MNKAFLKCGLAVCGFVAGFVPTEAADGFESLVHLTFDSDLESKVYVERNGTPVEYAAADGMITYQPLTRCVVRGGEDVPGRLTNDGYLTLDKARVCVPLGKFALSNDLDTVTFEMFVRADGDAFADWVEWLWISPVNGTPAADAYANRMGSLFYSQVQSNPSNIGLEVLQKTHVRTVFDGKWHHIAAVIQPDAESGGSTITYYVDYANPSVAKAETKWTGRENFWLVIGGRANTGRVDVDELRITKGALPVANFLHRYANGALADGDAYLYLPLDGDRRSIACMDDVVALTAYDSAPAYATNVLERRICEWGDWSVQPRPGTNAICQYANKSRSTIRVDNPWLCDGVERPLTIEFFMKGSDSSDEIATWGEKFRLKGSSGYDLLMQANGSKKYYFRADSQNGEGNLAIVPNIYEYDGKWHHFAFTFEPGTDGQGTKITAYADYRQYYQATIGGSWMGYRSGAKTLSFGTEVDVLWCDEVRISKGVLPVSKFLRQSVQTRPANGDAVLYLPLDGDLASSVCPGDNLVNAPGGTAFTAADPWKGRVVEYGDDGVVVRAENAGSLLRAKQQCSISLSSEWLTNGLDTVTIEFFMKGSSVDGEMSTWGEKLRIASNARGYALLVQADDSKRYYFRFDGESKSSVQIVPEIRIDDGKWHHFAFTIAPNANGGSDVTCYADYGDGMSRTLTRPWVGLGEGMTLNFGTDKDVLWFDELRITKGVLPKEKFLRQRNGGGMIMVIR